MWLEAFRRRVDSLRNIKKRARAAHGGSERERAAAHATPALEPRDDERMPLDASIRPKAIDPRVSRPLPDGADSGAPDRTDQHEGGTPDTSVYKPGRLSVPVCRSGVPGGA